jgi:hypothetical protein
MNTIRDALPRKITVAGGVLITLSGILNTILGIQIRAIYYDPYPGGKMGHVGIIAGLIAVVIGLIILLGLPILYNSPHNRWRVIAGFLTPVLGHLGAVFGALYVGTLGVFFCYLAGIWLLVIYLQESKASKER